MKAHVLYGPPGCGKTTELISRVRRAVDAGSRQENICVISFTKAAARNIADRARLSQVQISTIHSLAFRLAGITKEQVIGAAELDKFSRMTGYTISGANPEDCEHPEIGDHYLALHSLMVTLMHDGPRTTFSNFGQDGSMRDFESFCQSYSEFKEAHGLVDFADMLDCALDSPAQVWDSMLIDEAQDLSPLQWKLIRHWGTQVGNMHIAGDDDQSIYVWGGADPAGMHTFAREHDADVQHLGKSYRVPGAVHAVAQTLIQTVTNRVEKEYAPTDLDGLVRRFDSPQTVPAPAHGDDVLILYRNHSLRSEIEDVLIEEGTPYTVDSGKPGALHGLVARAYRSLCVAVDEWKKNGAHNLKGRELANLVRFCPAWAGEIQKKDMSFALGKRASEILCGDPVAIDYVARVARTFGAGVVPTIHLSTIHGSKGREADRVILLNAMGERSVESMQRDPDSEIRTFYVGITRAKNVLDIVYGKNPLAIL